MSMFGPKYTITQKLLANIKCIAALVAELNSKSFPKVVLAEFERRARELSAFSSTSIEGNPLPLTDVKRILKNKPVYIRDSEREVLNYNKTLLRLNESAEKGKVTFNLELILNIQKSIMQGLIQSYGCGKIRREAVFVNDPRSGKTVYLPPDYQDAPLLMKELLNYIKINKSAVDSLILAGIFHKQFVLIHPFIDGNGRTARLAAKVLLAGMGLNTFNLFSFENYYNNNVTRYFQNVGAIGNYYDIKNKIDFTGWLEYFTEGIIDELMRVEKELKTAAASPETELKPHHRKIIKHIKENGFITDKKYARLVSRAKPTRNLDFRKLIKMEMIEKFGKGKATYYKFKIL